MGRRRLGGSFGGDDRAIMPVFEAVLVAVIIFTGILFVTLTSRPSQGEGGGVDLGRVAADTLAILDQRPADDPAKYHSALEEAVALALRGDTAEADQYLEEVLPVGTRYALRLDNGVDSLQLLPVGSKAVAPRNALGAEVLHMPNWTATGIGSSHAPDRPLDFSAWTSLEAPDGSQVGPGGVSWLGLWSDAVPDQDRVPTWAPYGWWQYDHPPACIPCHVRIVHPDGTAADRPVYGLELLVWDGA